MKPGERVVAMTTFRDKLMIIGNLGSLIEMTWDDINGLWTKRDVADLERPRGY